MKSLKHPIIFFIALSFVSCKATQMMVTFDNPVIKVYDAKGTKDELFVKANRWMVTVFKDARSVVQFSDKGQGTLIGKYLLRVSPYNPYYAEQPIYAVIEITVKDEKARISIKPDNYSYTKANYGVAYWNGTQDSSLYSKELALAEIEALCESFHRSLAVTEPEF